MHAYSVIKKH